MCNYTPLRSFRLSGEINLFPSGRIVIFEKHGRLESLSAKSCLAAIEENVHRISLPEKILADIDCYL